MRTLSESVTLKDSSIMVFLKVQVERFFLRVKTSHMKCEIQIADRKLGKRSCHLSNLQGSMTLLSRF